MRAFEIVADKLYAVSDTKLLEIDLATGNRKLLSNAKDPGGLGGGPINAEGLGDRWIRWDPYRKVLWTYDLFAIVKYEIKTGNAYTFSL